jgi:hypothetical protein
MERAAERTQVVSGSISCRGILLSDGRTLVAAGDSCGRSACSAFSARRDGDGLSSPESRAALRRALMGGRGGRRETAHNVTAAADYRTALLSDSPYGAVRYAPSVSGDHRRFRPAHGLERGPATFRSTGPRGTPTNLTHLASRRVALAHKNKQQQNIPRRGRPLTKCILQATEKTKRILLSLWLPLWIQ